MKHLFYKVLGVVAGLFAMGFAVSAQTKELVHDFSEFRSLDVASSFEVTLSKGEYGVKILVDAPLAPYVQTYVKGKSLYITLDQKSLPADIKKMYKGRKAPAPVMRAMVYTPELEAVTLSGSASLTATDDYDMQNFELSLSDAAKVKVLRVNTNVAEVKLRKKASASLGINATGEISLTTEGSSSLNITGGAHDLRTSSSGSSGISFSGEVENNLDVNSGGSSQVGVVASPLNVKVNMANSSRVNLSGSAETLEVKGANSAFLDASGMPFVDVTAELSSCKAAVTLDGKLKVTLVGGGELFYNGTPEFVIDKIIRSTLAPMSAMR